VSVFILSNVLKCLVTIQQPVTGKKQMEAVLIGDWTRLHFIWQKPLNCVILK